MTVGRLKPGVSLEQALANMESVQTALGQQYPDSDADLGVRIQSLKELTVGGVRRSIWLIFGAVSLLLLLACTNIAALLLSRAIQRQHEIAVRVSLGASRGSIIAQRMTEAFVLSLAGGALGLVLAASVARVFSTLAANVPRIQEMHLDWRLVSYTLACSVAVTVLCGLLPAFTATRGDMRVGLAAAGRTQTSSRTRTRWGLVGMQVALAVTLLSGAGLLLRSFQELGRVAPGFESSRVLALNISLSWAEADADDPRPHVQWTQRILDGLRAVPGVEAAAIAYAMPGDPSGRQTELELVEGRGEGTAEIIADNQFVSASYFDTLHIPLLAGELCEDNTSQGMVNRRFADLYLNGSGYHLRSANRETDSGTLIQGIVGDVRENALDQPPAPTVYHCAAVAYPTTLYLIRTSGDPTALGDTLRRRIQEIEPSRSVFDITPLAQHLSDTRGEERLRTTLLAFFAATAILLASLGLYGTLGYVVGVRRREIGLRLALGAESESILKHFLAQGLAVSAVGAVAGIALALAAGGVLEGLLYGVSPADPPTLAGVVLLVLSVTGAASLLPAIRASRVEPMHVLREE
jgi:putative ABC transport system permease protein